MTENVPIDVQEGAEEQERTRASNVKTKTGKDRWEIADVLIKPLGGILTAVAVAGCGYYASLHPKRAHSVVW